MKALRARERSTFWLQIGLGVLLLLHITGAPARAQASPGTEAPLCRQRVVTLRATCFANLRAAGLQGSTRLAAARTCRKDMRARLQACRTRATTARVALARAAAVGLSAESSSAAPMLTTDKFDYQPGDIITITGSGWQSSETVTMVLSVTPATHADV